MTINNSTVPSEGCTVQTDAKKTTISSTVPLEGSTIQTDTKMKTSDKKCAGAEGEELVLKWKPFLQQPLRRWAPSKLRQKWQPFFQQSLQKGAPSKLFKSPLGGEPVQTDTKRTTIYSTVPSEGSTVQTDKIKWRPFIQQSFRRGVPSKKMKTI